MRYKVMTEPDGSIKQYQGNYYIASSDGTQGVVTKDWIKQNIQFFSNISISGNQLYLIKDKFDQAIILVTNDLLKQLTKSGVNTRKELELIQAIHNQHQSTRPTLTTKSSKLEAWKQITWYRLDSAKIFFTCLYKAIETLGADRGYHIWAVSSPDNEIITCSQQQAELIAAQTGGTIKQVAQGDDLGEIEDQQDITWR